jgi:protease-4
MSEEEKKEEEGIENNFDLTKSIENVLNTSLNENLKEKRSSRRWSNGFKVFASLYLSVILFSFIGNGILSVDSSDFNDDHIAVVHIDGQIAFGTDWSSSNINAGLKEAFDATNSKAVFISINSPGGSPVQSDQVFTYIMKKKAETGKPVYAVINDLGASGAYYIAAAADYIYSNKMSLVGSIGVISGSFGFTGAMEKLGVERRVYTAGENKSMLDPFSKEDPKQIEKWNQVLSDTHEEFIYSVGLGRGDRLVRSDDIFSGRIWSGKQALELGLIDGFNSVGSLAEEKYNLSSFKNYTVSNKSINQIFKSLGLNFSEGILATLSDQNSKLY